MGVVLEFTAIGTIKTPFLELMGMPIQPAGAAEVKGTIEVLPEYAEGLRDLEGFSHIILLYVFHRSEGFNLSVVPYMDTVPRGLFSTRAPKRPNPIGLSIVRLVGVEGTTIQVEGVDMLDGTPLLDIKPYVPDFIPSGEMRTGWLDEARRTVSARRSDGRFT